MFKELSVSRRFARAGAELGNPDGGFSTDSTAPGKVRCFRSFQDGAAWLGSSCSEFVDLRHFAPRSQRQDALQIPVKDDSHSVDAPSPELLKRLNDLGLASDREIRGCRRYLSQIARDLPLFDSVWLDALVRARALTPFQARALERPDGPSVRVGPWLLVDRIDSDGFPELFRARVPGGAGQKMLSRCRTPVGEGAKRLPRLLEAVERMRSIRSGGLRSPIECGQDEAGLYIVSEECAGTTLHDILVRRGRFDGGLVCELAKLLLAAMNDLHTAGEVHGDVRLRNVWLDQGKRGWRAGSPVVVANPVLAAIARPQVSIHDEWPLDSLDVAAPEAIGPQGVRTSRGDLYSLGCLLWQLLSGRPPHPTADPIAKLIAHQKRNIVDIRAWAPETPRPLAELIGSLVERDPARRPDGAGAALERLTKDLRARPFSRKAAPPTVRMSPRSPRGKSSLRSAGLAICCVMGLGTVVGLIKRSDRTPETLSLPSPGPSTPDVATGGTDDAQAWPKPQDGQIVLEHAGPWKASKISAVGPLVVRGAPGIRPVIEVDEHPLELWGERVLISGVDFRLNAAASAAPGNHPPDALLSVGAQLVQIQECRFESPSEIPASRKPVAAVRWSLIDTSPTAAARLLVKNSSFLGQMPGVEIPAPHGSVAFSHVLKSGSGELISVPPGRSASPTPRTIHLRGTTLRGESPLLRAHATPPTRWKVTADHTVIAITNAALFEYFAENPPAGWERDRLLEFEGRSTVLSMGTPLVAGRDVRESLIPWPDEGFSIDGVLFDDPQFAGGPDEAWSAQRLTGLTIPLPDETLPGIGASPF